MIGINKPVSACHKIKIGGSNVNGATFRNNIGVNKPEIVSLKEKQ